MQGGRTVVCSKCSSDENSAEAEVEPICRGVFGHIGRVQEMQASLQKLEKALAKTRISSAN